MRRRSIIKTIEAKDGSNVKTNKLSEPPTRTRVVIVGAGLAGLSAAQRLYESGITDVVLLEGQSRIGGRVFTINHGDYLLELGAQWLHGANENPLFSWCNHMNMLDDFEDGNTGMAGLFCDNRSKKLSDKVVSKFLDAMVDIKLSLSNNDLAAMVETHNFRNAAQVFKHELDKRQLVDGELSPELVASLFEWFLRYESIENSCDSMEHVSISSYTDYSDFSEGAALNFRNGYRSLLEHFCSQMPTEQIVHLNKQVLKIELVGSKSSLRSPLLIKYCNTNSDKLDAERCIECDHVLVTSSLGFLKKHAESLFKPPLPRLKMDLIESIGFGTVNKIILQFETRFWHNDHGIKLVWLSQDEQSDKDNSLPSWARDIIAFDSVRRQPNLLIGWIGGLGAKAIEQETDAKVADVCLQLLERFLPENHSKPSKLIACVCSRWHSNAFTLGSYSFQSMESFDKNVDKLHEPIYEESSVGLRKLQSSSKVPRILFAGEATAGKLYSTAHGAVISGWREADRLKGYLLSEKSNINYQQEVSKCQKLVEL